MQKSREDCPCKRARCPRHGNCEACRAHHAGSKYSAACDRAVARAPKKAGLGGAGPTQPR